MGNPGRRAQRQLRLGGAGPHPHDQVSPISFTSKIRTPVLIVHGEDDTNVPASQAVYFHRALSWSGAEHELARGADMPRSLS